MEEMERLKFIVIGMCVILCAGISFGHPPTDVKLNYDQATGILHIEMTHVTGNIREHHIRKLIVFRNQKEILNETIVKQTTPHHFAMDIPLIANPADVIIVRAFCKEGGSLEESITIPAPEGEKESQP